MMFTTLTTPISKQFRLINYIFSINFSFYIFQKRQLKYNILKKQEKIV